MAACDGLESQLATAQSESRRLLEAILHEDAGPGDRAKHTPDTVAV